MSSTHSSSAALALDASSSRFAICRLPADHDIPSWASGGPFISISRSAHELSIVCEEEAVPAGVECQRGWRGLRVRGPLDTALVGVLASLALPLARAKISLFAISTFDTDYLLVREHNFTRAVEALRDFGHHVETPPEELVPPEEPEEPREEPEEPEPPREEPEEPEPPREEPEEPEPPREEPEEPEPPREEPEEPEPPREEPEEPEPPREEPEAREEPEEPEPPREEPEEPEPPREEPEAPEPPREEPPRGKAAPVDEFREDDRNVTSRGLYTGAIPQHPVETIEEPFTSLGLSAPILETVAELGFEHPTPVQAQVIPHALAGRDVVGLAETGSGKTAAFALPLAERLTHGRGVRGLILCPTREIALQTQAFLDIFGRDHELVTVVVIGGVRMGPQIKGLRRGPDIIVATPGRLADHIRRGNVRLDHIEHLVLDEADHMLDLGFLPQIKEVLEQVPEGRQTMMFSATMPPPIERLSKQFMNDPVRVDLRPKGRAAAGIEHRLYLVHDEDDRKKCLYQLLREVSGSTLIFVRRKLHTEWLARQLELAGFPVERIHSDRSQGQRVHALRGFREGEHEILVATDVAARGIDVPRISHVINFGLPDTVEDYIHRSGRTARGSALGIVSSIGTWKDKEMVREIESTLGQKLERCQVEGVRAYEELKPRKTVRRRRLL